MPHPLPPANPPTEPPGICDTNPTGGAGRNPGQPDSGPEPAWDLTALRRPKIIKVPRRGGGTTEETVTRATAALAAQAAGDPVAPDLIHRLAHAGVVAIRVGRTTYLCRETVTSWVLLPTRRRATARTLAKAAATRAHHLAALRRRTTHTPPGTGPDPETAMPDAVAGRGATTANPDASTGEAGTTTAPTSTTLDNPPSATPYLSTAADEANPRVGSPTRPPPDPADPEGSAAPGDPRAQPDHISRETTR
ncbi:MULTISPECIES: hypothetical protein [unclassified Pseudofrankia]|uniref:hypothetical protein n=1 Tax=unclassified Pseudofrankia TaxID=2994372 RepID=UPI0008DB27C7|nr:MULTISPECIES: hypothetical protein [unclassified Pseudofrankia]MDT3444455.1 hypothetical protein [Pseudofrankia sp. BMG5.37]OHV57982.1 hypothetical protein BCD48_42665 [Pseudofrankia sp. BMG5.36]